MRLWGYIYVVLLQYSCLSKLTLTTAVQIDGREEKEYPDKRPKRWEDWGGEDRGWGQGCAVSVPEHPALFWAFDTDETWRLCPQRLRVAGGGGLGSVRHRKRKGRSESIMHQIRKIHNLSLQQTRNLHPTEPHPHKKPKTSHGAEQTVRAQQQPMGKIDMQIYSRN